MSMLAEPRRKVRYCINPNGNTWANDSNAFGKKMLEKMGWSNGKGLGANLDGMTSHVKVNYKSDQGGVGFKDRNDQWTVHEDNFTALLKNLQEDGHQVAEAETSNQPTTKSLELKSKASKSRVHYKKFTRGKDLSRYSSKDLANIFGRKTLEKTKHIEVNNEVEKDSDGGSNSNSSDDVKQKQFGVETLQGGSMTDYFKKKMSQFKLSFSSKVEKDVDDDYEARPAFGLGFGASNDKNLNDNQPELGGSGFGYKGFVQATDNSDENNKKDKKRKRKLESNDDNEDEEVKIKSKKSKKGLMNEGFDNVTDENCESVPSLDNNLLEIKSKVKKNKKNKKSDVQDEVNGLENEAFNDTIEDNEGIDNKVKVKKSKVKKNKNLGLENPNFDINDSVTDEIEVMSTENPYEVVPKVKKNKKQKKSLSNESGEAGFENPNFDENSLQDLENDKSLNETLETPVNPYEVVVKDKKTKKKNKKSGSDENVGLENPVFNETENSEEMSPSPKKKKKKSKNKTTEESFTAEEIDETEVPEEVKEPKKKKKNKNNEDKHFDIANTNEVSSNVNVEIIKTKKRLSQCQGEDDQSQKPGVDVVNLGVDSNVHPKVVSTTPNLNSNLTLSNNFGITDDLILNISSTDPKPILTTPKNRSTVKRRKSVRIDESLNQERIIPNILQQKQMLLQGKNVFEVCDVNNVNCGIANDGFDLNSKDQGFYEQDLDVTPLKKSKNVGISNLGFRNVEEEMEDVQKSLENYQAEVENDINDIKSKRLGVNQTSVETNSDEEDNVEDINSQYIGSVSKLTEHTKHPNGHVLLAYKHANISQAMNHFDSKSTNIAKRSYRQLIKGDIEVEFQGTNLHEFTGYATPETLAKLKSKKKKPLEEVADDNRVEKVENERIAKQVKDVPVPKEHLTDAKMIKILTDKVEARAAKKEYWKDTNWRERKFPKGHRKGKKVTNGQKGQKGHKHFKKRHSV